MFLSVAGGDFGGLDDYEQPHDADVAETSAAAQKRARKQNRNPGSRLRNELKRKSLAAGAPAGLCEELARVVHAACLCFCFAEVPMAAIT